jgi:hypothetical protein
MTVKSSKYTLKEENIQSYTDQNGISYHIGGNLYNENWFFFIIII